MKRLTVGFLLTLVCLSVLLQGAPAVQGQDAPFTIRTINIPDMPAYDMRVSPDGQTAAVYIGQIARVFLNVPLVAYGVDESHLPIQLIDLTTGTELGRLSGHTDYVDDLAFTPDGQRLASYHPNGDIYLWDIASLQPIQRVTAIMGQGTRVKFLPDGQTLVAYTAFNRVGQFFLWDMETGSMTEVWRASYRSFGDLKLEYPPDAYDYSYTTFDISPDGTLLATATYNDEVMLWDTATLEQTLVQPKAPEDERMQLSVRTVLFSADGQTLVYFDSRSEQTHFWDVPSRTETAVLTVGGRSFGLSPDKDKLAWATREELWFVDLNQPDQPVKVMNFPAGIGGTGPAGLPGVVFSPDGSRFVVGGIGYPDGREGNVLYVITLN